jgi:hypothetical protein
MPIPKSGPNARSDELFHRFARDMAEKPNGEGKWLYNYDTSGDEPADFGYWLGAEICRSYYSLARRWCAAAHTPGFWSETA